VNHGSDPLPPRRTQACSPEGLATRAVPTGRRAAQATASGTDILARFLAHPRIERVFDLYFDCLSVGASATTARRIRERRAGAHAAVHQAAGRPVPPPEPLEDHAVSLAIEAQEAVLSDKRTELRLLQSQAAATASALARELRGELDAILREGAQPVAPAPSPGLDPAPGPGAAPAGAAAGAARRKRPRPAPAPAGPGAGGAGPGKRVELADRAPDLTRGQVVEGDALRKQEDMCEELKALYGDQIRAMAQEIRSKKPRVGIPPGATAVLLEWFDRHFAHPYPADGDKVRLCAETGLTKAQLDDWFINRRKRQWFPLFSNDGPPESQEEVARLLRARGIVDRGGRRCRAGGR